MNVGFLEWSRWYPENIDEESLIDDLDMTIRELNELIWIYRKENGIDIGCTMSLLVLLNEKYHVFHVGDSKILLIDDRVSQITKDEVSVVERDGKLKTFIGKFYGEGRRIVDESVKRKPCSGRDISCGVRRTF